VLSTNFLRFFGSLLLRFLASLAVLRLLLSTTKLLLLLPCVGKTPPNERSVASFSRPADPARDSILSFLPLPLPPFSPLQYLTSSTTSVMTIDLASKRQRELLGSSYDAVLTAHQYQVPMDPLVKWGKEFGKLIGEWSDAPHWLARDTDFCLLLNWISSLLHAIKHEKVSLLPYFYSRNHKISNAYDVGFDR